jgi:hypothetical protein
MYLSVRKLSSLYTHLFLTRGSSSFAVVGFVHYLSSRTNVEYEKDDVAQPTPRINSR